MKYHGGKARIGEKLADKIFEIVQFFSDRGIKFKSYIEPFCGMMGVYQHIIPLTGNSITYKAGDTNMDLIAMWKALQKGWKPPQRLISEEQFNAMKEKSRSSNKNDPLRGYVGFAYSYRGIFFSTYFPLTPFRIKTLREEMMNKGKLFSKVKFINKSYEYWSNVEDCKDCILYLDPPYERQNIYYEKLGKKIHFDSEAFWDWVRKMSKNNLVLVSEYKAPKDFINLINIKEEKLFVWNPLPL